MGIFKPHVRYSRRNGQIDKIKNPPIRGIFSCKWLVMVPAGQWIPADAGMTTKKILRANVMIFGAGKET